MRPHLHAGGDEDRHVGRAHPAERERSLVLQEEVTLLGKEQTEPRQSELLLVGLCRWVSRLLTTFLTLPL